MRIWVDLTNSPHVLVMRPVIETLREHGHEVEVTARDFAQTLELCERFGIAHTAIGRHRGGRVGAKALGLAARSTALTRWARGRRFDRAMGHGSNDVTVAAAILRIPSATTFDYEWATVQHNVNCRLAADVVVPDAIPPERLYRYGARGKIRAYPGLKEEYYLADFEPDPSILDELGLDPTRPIAVVRTPPEVSLYHRFENDLFAGVLERLADVQTVVLPRTPRAAIGAAANRAVHRPRARDRRPVADRLRRRRGVGRRDDEPGGGGARNARVHGVRGPPRGGRRAPDRRGPAAAPDQPGRPPRSSSEPAAGGADRTACGATRGVLAGPADRGATLSPADRVRVLNRLRRSPVSGLMPKLRLPAAVAAVCACALALSAAAAQAAPIGAFTTKGAWSFVSAPKLHPPKLTTDVPTPARARPGLLHDRGVQEPRGKQPLTGESGPLILDSKPPAGVVQPDRRRMRWRPTSGCRRTTASRCSAGGRAR